MTSIKCDATSCKHNNEGVCVKEKIHLIVIDSELMDCICFEYYQSKRQKQEVIDFNENKPFTQTGKDLF